MVNITVCPGSSNPLYIVSYYIKRVTTSWTHRNFVTGDSRVVCPQRKYGEIIGVEDCLYMNIYVPITNDTGNIIIIIVFIYIYIYIYII